jgi:hypothetical protein
MVDQIDRVGGYVMLILRRDEPSPMYPWIAAITNKYE